MGRKCVPTGIKKQRGNPGHRPLNAAEPMPTPGRPQCPAHIQGEAKAEWDRITGELEGMGLLTSADRGVIALYCQAWARWAHAEAEVMKIGEVIKAPYTGTAMANPWLSIANKAHEQCHKLMAEIGLTPSARSKIKVQKVEAPPGELEF